MKRTVVWKAIDVRQAVVLSIVIKIFQTFLRRAMVSNYSLSLKEGIGGRLRPLLPARTGFLGAESSSLLDISFALRLRADGLASDTARRLAFRLLSRLPRFAP